MFETDIGIHGAANRLAIARPQEATLKIADTGTDLAGLIVPAFVGPFGIGNYGTGDKHHVAAPIGNRLIRKGGSQDARSEEHTSELQSLMRISYAVFCLKKNKTHNSERLLTRHRTR